MGWFSFNRKQKPEPAPKGRLEISDESGFIGIINGDLYQGFVNEDWELDDVLEKFRTQTNRGHCAIWSTGEPYDMAVQLLESLSDQKAVREATINIQITDESLWLANYTDLTMAAQFEDEPIPSKMNSHLRIALDNGNYEVHIRQMTEPKAYEWKEAPEYHFELVFERQEAFEKNQFENVLWWDQDDLSKE
ncbi:MAG: hypothetical protein HEP71_05165 [Roseivirga sp.]|nr:hypothetical protein [Roseivirga sp.]